MTAHLLPLFPLPNVVLFPGCFLPVHVFEARYRVMIADVCESTKLLILALLKPGWEAEYHKNPPVYDTACVCRISAMENLPDGRYNVLLEGVDRVRILDEVRNRPYREVVTNIVRPGGEAEDYDRIRVLKLLSKVLDHAPVEVPEGLLGRLSQITGNSLLADTIAHILQIPVQQKQAILETLTITDRLNFVYDRLAEIEKRIHEKGEAGA